MTASAKATLATILAAGLSAYFAGLGLAVLATILGTTLVVALATREQNERIRDAQRKVLREAAWREMAGRNGCAGRTRRT